MHILTMNKDVEECIENCQECHQTCVELLTYCVEKGDKHTDPEHIRVLRDCAEICQTSANFMLRGSNLHSLVCGICAEICRKCSESCEKFEDDDKMRICAEMCKKCAATCKEMGRSPAT